jgi:hypothetical protein
MGVNCLLHHFFLPLKLVDSVFQKLLFGLDEFDLFFFRRDDLAEFLLEFSLQFFDPLFVFGFHLLDDFFVDSNLLIEGVDNDVLFLFHVLEFIHEAVVDGFELPGFGRFFLNLFESGDFLEQDIIDQLTGGVLKIAERASTVFFR